MVDYVGAKLQKLGTEYFLSGRDSQKMTTITFAQVSSDVRRLRGEMSGKLGDWLHLPPEIRRQRMQEYLPLNAEYNAAVKIMQEMVSAEAAIRMRRSSAKAQPTI